jgi:hypothetical protein
MPYVEVDVDVDEFYDRLSIRERDELIDLLKEDGHLEAKKLVVAGEEELEDLMKGNLLDIEWAQVITKINGARYRLSFEQNQVLIDLAKSL